MRPGNAAPQLADAQPGRKEAAGQGRMVGTRYCISQMRGPAPRQGACEAPWNPLLNSYKL